MSRNTKRKAAQLPLIEDTDISQITPDESNPRESDPARMQLLRLSLSKLGFVLPIVATKEGFLLSGHQRHRVATELGFETIPVQFIDVDPKDVRGINIMFNRATNDFNPMDTGSNSASRVTLESLIEKANEFEDYPDDAPWFATDCKMEDIRGYAESVADKYNKKSVVTVNNLSQKGITIPIVISESGHVVNGAHRLFAAREDGITRYPVIRVPDEYAELSDSFLNYLSMDYKVGGDFEQLLRYSAYRRPQNNRGSVPKAYRFWANGERTLLDKDSYTKDYWRRFRDIHGRSILDFGAGLGKVAPFLCGKGLDCIDFEPFRLRPVDGNEAGGTRAVGRSTAGESGSHAGFTGRYGDGSGTPDPDYSRAKAREFLAHVRGGRIFDSIFMASVLNSIPFPRDRMCALACVHALCSLKTVVYGTCRDISDFHYEYSGIRNASYFVFDSEPGVRLGDAISNPKIQKFHSQEEAAEMFKPFWNKVEFWKGGNVFYWRCTAPKRINRNVLEQALRFEFDLPYADGSTMGLGEEAVQAYTKRLAK